MFGEKSELTLLQYVSHGDPEGPKTVLRGFEEAVLVPGEAKTVTFALKFRDLATWDTASQNWVLAAFEKKIFVGSSSRDFKLNATVAL